MTENTPLVKSEIDYFLLKVAQDFSPEVQPLVIESCQKVLGPFCRTIEHLLAIRKGDSWSQIQLDITIKSVIEKYLSLPDGENEYRAPRLPEPSSRIIDKLQPLNLHFELFDVLVSLSGLPLITLTKLQWKDDCIFFNPLPLQIGHPERVDLRLLDGDLGIPDRNSETVTMLINYLDKSLNLFFAVPQLLLSGSGVGKTKALFDFLKNRYGILYDCSNPGKDFDQMEREIRRLTADPSKFPLYEDDCEYQLHLTIAARGVTLLLYHVHCNITPKDWLYSQLNGIATYNYEKLLMIIRDYLRWRFKRSNEMSQFCITTLQELSNYLNQRLIFVIDEGNILLNKLPNTFQSSDKRMSRPLFTFIVDRVMSLPVMLVVAGTKLELKDKDLWESVVAKQGASRGKEQQNIICDLPLLTRDTGSIYINALFKPKYSKIAQKLFFSALPPPDRFRFLTTWCEILAERDSKKYLVRDMKDAKEQLNDSLVHYMEMLQNCSADWSIPSMIKRFEDKNGKSNTCNLFCELVYSYLMKDGMITAQKTIEWMSGGFCRLYKYPHSEYKIEEELIINCVTTYLRNQNVKLVNYYLQQIQRMDNSATVGIMMDIFLALAFHDLQGKLVFSFDGKKFEPTVTSFYYYNTATENTPLHELLRKEFQYILAKHITGPDGLLRCGNVLYVIACKTTHRYKKANRSVDERDAANNFERTDLNNLFPGRISEQDDQRRSASLRYIAKTIESVIRIHFIFPKASKNWKHTSKERIEDLVILHPAGSKRKHDEDKKRIPQYVFNVSLLSNLKEYFPQNLMEYLNTIFC